MKRRDLWVLFGIVAALSALLLLRGLGATAPTPGVFSDAHTLESAAALSAESGKPVLALATADWCGPCQALKRGALSDPAVVAFLREHTIPVYLEEASSPAEIASLGVRAYPTTVLIADGQTLGVIEGNRPAADYLEAVLSALNEPG